MITVSLCMIVKNEEQVLSRCLDSFSKVADEIIVVDTGSTDRTKEIAAKYTSRIFDFKWVDDFSAARNFAFSKCSMDYIYSADADEVIDENNIRSFMALKENILPEIEMVQMWYVNKHEHATTENFIKEYRPKLFKRLRTFTWIEPIHEMVNLTPVVYDSDIEILHMPVSLHSDRDFKTFQKAIDREGKLSSRLHSMYARELLISGSMADFENAKEYFENSLSDSDKTMEENEQSYAVLAKYFRLINDTPQFFKYALKNIVTTPSSEVCVELGIFYKELGDIDEAILWFINAGSETKPILVAECGSKKPYLYLEECYRILAENIKIFDEELSASMLDKALEYKEMADNIIFY